MQRERVADDIYIFTSERYAQVTAGVVLTSEGAVLIDTLLFPEETRQIQHFVENRLRCPIRYIIQTHYHADHCYGAYLFPEAIVISSKMTAKLQETRGRAALMAAQQGTYELRDVHIVAPHITFRDEYMLQVGNKTIHIWAAPGHSPDMCMCLVREDRILFAADAMLPIPHFVDGDYLACIETLQTLQANPFECIIQGHGDVVLRGEIESKLASDLAYLTQVRHYVGEAHRRSEPERYLAKIEVEKCGKSRHLLGGLVQRLHSDNLNMLYRQVYTVRSEPDGTVHDETDDPTESAGEQAERVSSAADNHAAPPIDSYHS